MPQNATQTDTNSIAAIGPTRPDSVVCLCIVEHSFRRLPTVSQVATRGDGLIVAGVGVHQKGTGNENILPTCSLTDSTAKIKSIKD